MGKVYSNRQCSTCPTIGTVIESWGTYYCRTCYEARPKRANGNGGMVFKGAKVQDYEHDSVGVTLERCKKSHPIFCDLYLSHYPGSKGIMGRSLNYLVRLDGIVAGIIGANSPPLNYKIFRKFFETDDENMFLNNNVYRMINNTKNLGTQVLRAFRNTVAQDYEDSYGVKILGLCTFVEPPRSGAIYLADNWTCLGETQGKSVRKRDMSTWENKEWSQGTKKLIFAIKARPHNVKKMWRAGVAIHNMQQELAI